MVLGVGPLYVVAPAKTNPESTISLKKLMRPLLPDLNIDLAYIPRLVDAYDRKDPNFIPELKKWARIESVGEETDGRVISRLAPPGPLLDCNPSFS